MNAAKVLSMISIVWNALVLITVASSGVFLTAILLADQPSRETGYIVFVWAIFFAIILYLLAILVLSIFAHKSINTATEGGWAIYLIVSGIFTNWFAVVAGILLAANPSQQITAQGHYKMARGFITASIVWNALIVLAIIVLNIVISFIEGQSFGDAIISVVLAGFPIIAGIIFIMLNIFARKAIGKPTQKGWGITMIVIGVFTNIFGLIAGILLVTAKEQASEKKVAEPVLN